MQRIAFKCALVLMSVLAAPFSLAEDVAPDVLLKAVTLEVIAIIRQDNDIRAGNPAKVADLVETRILPLFDFTRMTELAMARNWRLATPGQRKVLTTEFKTLLVRTYSTALSSYRDQVIEFKPLRAASGDTEVTVKSVMKQPGKEPLNMDYAMEKTAEGWKVDDIKIDGVSLVMAYRDTFAGKVREGGVDGLIKSLSDKNRQSDARFRSNQTDNFYIPVAGRLVLQTGGGMFITVVARRSFGLSVEGHCLPHRQKKCAMSGSVQNRPSIPGILFTRIVLRTRDFGASEFDKCAVLSPTILEELS